MFHNSGLGPAHQLQKFICRINPIIRPGGEKGGVI